MSIVENNEQIYYREGVKAFRYGFFGDIFLALSKGIVAVISGSQAMLSDAIHSSADLISILVGFVAFKIARRSPDKEHPYGHGRMETVAAKIVGLFIILTGLGIGYNSWNIIMAGEVMTPRLMALWMALTSVLGKELLFHVTFKIGNRIGSNAVMASAKHHRSDALSSLMVIVGVLGSRFGYPSLDPLAGILVALLIIKLGVSLYWKSVAELIDAAPDDRLIEEIIEISEGLEGVNGVSSIKGRMHGPFIYVDMKVCIDPMISVEKGHEIAHHVSSQVKGQVQNIKEIMIHVDPCYYDAAEHESDCSYCRAHGTRMCQSVEEKLGDTRD